MLGMLRDNRGHALHPLGATHRRTPEFHYDERFSGFCL